MNTVYKYETHLHTKEASACGFAYGAEYISFFKKLGYQGIFVTDHFFNGNSGIDRSLPWEDKIHLFCKGYENALEEGKKQELDVFFGWESNFDGDEYLIYGLDKEWLLQHPEMMEWNQKEQFEQIHASGGAIVQAHPFRVRNYLQRINLHPYHVDAVEVFNAGNDQPNDALAYQYCLEKKLPMTAGSDIHRISDGPLYGVTFEKPLSSAADYAKALREGRKHGVFYEEGREILKERYIPPLPVYLFDYQNEKKIL